MNEVTVATAEIFPLKKDEKNVKCSVKPIVEEKKSSQKVTEVVSSKKPVDIKKSKRDKRDESSDSDDSDDGTLNNVLLN